MTKRDRGAGELAEDQIILEHYRELADQYGLDPTSTMLDLTTRELEVRSILECLEDARERRGGDGSLLEVGCGNGYLLKMIRERFVSLALTGLEYSPAMLELAEQRMIDRCEIRRGDVRALSFADGSFSIVVSERCLINVLDPSAQERALLELHRVLRPGGYLILIESFLDGLANLNRARAELGLTEQSVPEYNLWFDKERFLSAIRGRLTIVDHAGDRASLPPRNFLSTHYFVSRVLYPAITKEEIRFNTEFVKFFRFLPAQGDFSPIQLFYMQKVG